MIERKKHMFEKFILVIPLVISYTILSYGYYNMYFHSMVSNYIETIATITFLIITLMLCRIYTVIKRENTQ